MDERAGEFRIGEPALVTVALENEAGVCIRHPLSNHIWRHPESACVQEGLRTGVRLRLELEGHRAERFVMAVSNCLVDSDVSEGGGHAPEPHELLLNFSTGLASGMVTVLHARSYEDDTRLLSRASKTDAASERTQQRGGSDAGELLSGWVSLAISFPPAWGAKLNRPLLALSSLPFQLKDIPFLPSSSAHTSRGEVSTAKLPKPPFSSSPKQPLKLNADSPKWVVGEVESNVRHLVFEVGNRRPKAGGQDAAASEAPVEMGMAASVEDDVPDSDDDIVQHHREKQVVQNARSELRLEYTRIAPQMSGGSDESDKSPARANATRRVELSIVESAALGGYFGKVWDCSLAMAAFLADLEPPAMKDKRVVELGAGCGVVSAVCAALGAAEVVATDTDDLLPLLELNMRRNGSYGRAPVKVEEYTWGTSIEERPALAKGNFDVIICSDLLFDPSEWEALKGSLVMLGRRSTCVVYLAHRRRNLQEQEFFSNLEGFRCRTVVRTERGVRREYRHSGESAWSRNCFPDVALYESTLC